mgnify:CR=1 FL=1
MKTFNKILKTAALARVLTSDTAFASAFYIDTAGFLGANAGTDVYIGPGMSADLDGDSITGDLGGFKTDPVVPVSTYIDDNGTAGIQTGDTVTDVITGLALSLFPATTDGEGYGYAAPSTWSLELNWDLTGSTVVLPDASGDGSFNYLGNFTSGTVSFDITDEITGTTYNDALVLGLNGTNGNPTIPQDNAFLFTLFLEVESAMSGVFFTESDIDFATLAGTDQSIRFTAEAGLSDLDDNPNDNFVGNIAGNDNYTRTTSLQSVDIRMVSEPSTLAIFGLGLLGLAAAARRKA